MKGQTGCETRLKRLKAAQDPNEAEGVSSLMNRNVEKTRRKRKDKENNEETVGGPWKTAISRKRVDAGQKLGKLQRCEVIRAFQKRTGTRETEFS